MAKNRHVYALFLEPYSRVARLMSMTATANNGDTSTNNLLTSDVISAILRVPADVMTASTKLLVINLLNGRIGKRRSILWLARDIGQSKGTVILSTHALESLGVLSCHRGDTHDGTSYPLASRYTVNVDRILELAKPPQSERVWHYGVPMNGEVPDENYPHLGTDRGES